MGNAGIIERSWYAQRLINEGREAGRVEGREVEGGGGLAGDQREQVAGWLCGASGRGLEKVGGEGVAGVSWFVGGGRRGREVGDEPGEGGAVGYLSFNGDLDTAIHIRTALIKDGQIHIQAGGGTVADADPEYEYRESVNKAKAMFRAVEMACENPDWA